MKGVSILVYICLLLAAVLWHLVNFSGFFHISQLPSLIWFGFLANVCMSSLPRAVFWPRRTKTEEKAKVVASVQFYATLAILPRTTEATTFAFSSVFILLLWSKGFPSWIQGSEMQEICRMCSQLSIANVAVIWCINCFGKMFPFLNRIQHIYIIRNLTFFLCRPFSVLKTEETFTISRQLSARGEKFANGPGSVMIPSRVEWYFKFKTGVHTSHVAINCFKEQCFKKGKL